MPRAQNGSQNAAAHAADRLLDAIGRVGVPICVGLDPVFDRLPQTLRSGCRELPEMVSAIRSFCLHVLDAITPACSCVKVQSACFERYRAAGFEALFELIAEAHKRGLQVILDWKRGDIGISAEHYAAAAFDAADATCPDWITVSGYMGMDTVLPFLRPGRGVFVLVRTSNPGSDALQAIATSTGQSVAHAVAAQVAELGAESVGLGGYSGVGAVVGATKSADIRALRALMPHQILLIPGYGAQGGGPAEVADCFNPDGQGALVTASRSVIYTFQPDEAGWPARVGEAATRFAEDIRQVLPCR